MNFDIIITILLFLVLVIQPIADYFGNKDNADEQD